MYALVWKQLTDKDEDWNREGHLITNGLPLDTSTVTVYRLLDDDKIPYYLVIADDEGIEKMFDWAMADVGVTIVEEIALNDNATDVLWAPYMA